MVTTLSDIWDRAISPFLRLEPESNSERVRHTYVHSSRGIVEARERDTTTRSRDFSTTPTVLDFQLCAINSADTRDSSACNAAMPVESTRSINGTAGRKRTGRFRCSISGEYPLVLSDSTRAPSPTQR